MVVTGIYSLEYLFYMEKGPGGSMS
jgi:hypothetical protein